MLPTSGTRTISGRGSKPGGGTNAVFSSPISHAGVVSNAAANSSTLDCGMSLTPFSSLVMEDLER